MPKALKRDTSTPDRKKIWNMVETAAGTRPPKSPYKPVTVEIGRELRLGQAIYYAIFQDLKDRGKCHTDSAVLNELHTLSDACLLKLLKQ